MGLLSAIASLFSHAKGGKEQTQPAAQKRRLNVSEIALARARGKRNRHPGQTPSSNPFKAATPPPGVVPDGAGMAMDDAGAGLQQWAGQPFASGVIGRDGEMFLGYPLLAELALKPEYRRLSEIIATEMTRKWVEIQSHGDEDKSAKIKAIETELARLNVRENFKKAAEQDGFFGRGHLYLDFGATDDPVELKTPIGDGHNEISLAKVKKGSFERLKAVEAVWCYPSNYNSSDPLKPDWYRPSMWFVQGKEVHASRLLTFVAREVSDLLKPAYSFGGLSLSQMARPYVDNWLGTRQSVADIISAFSVFVLKTNLGEKLEVDEEGLFRRVDLFNQIRDNRGLMLLDKELEDFENVAAPLSTLDVLQAQTQEHMAAVSGIPTVKLLGIQPAGLNASSDGELECFYTWIQAQQESLFSPNLKRILGFVQLSLFGEVDPDIDFKWVPLKQLSEKEEAEIDKIEAETGAALIEAKVISPAEERARIANDPDTAYASLDLDVNPGLSEREKAEIAAGLTNAIVAAVDIVPGSVAMAELRRVGEITGVWSTISDEDIAEVDPNPPEPETDGNASDPFGSGTASPGNGPSAADPGTEAGVRPGEAR